MKREIPYTFAGCLSKVLMDVNAKEDELKNCDVIRFI